MEYVEITENYFDGGDTARPSSWEAIADSLEEYCINNNYDWNDYRELCYDKFVELDTKRHEDDNVFWISDSAIYEILINLIETA